MTKNEIRSQIKEAVKKEKSTFPQKSEIICKKIMASSVYKNSSIILAYMALQDEADLSCLIQQALLEEKKIYLPKVKSDSTNMDFFQFKKESKTNPGAFGILEPSEGNIFTTTNILQTGETEQILFLIPGRAFSKNGDRLGRGKAYYDTFLAKLEGELGKKIFEEKLLLAGIAFDFQLLDSLPVEKQDVKMKYLFTENSFLQF